MADTTSQSKIEEKIFEYLKPVAANVFRRALTHSSKIKAEAEKFISRYLKEHDLDGSKVSFACVGSVGRSEALESSDLDVCPIFDSDSSLQAFEEHVAAIRQGLQDTLKIKVSKGEDLTRSVAVQTLVDSECIGGTGDNSASLTKRVLLLTEGTQLGGTLQLTEIKRKILAAYGNEERTSGRHVLSLCNDLARYYRTLCIEYKAKVDAHDKAWSTRNMKLRHSRKLWYFSNMISIVSLAEKYPRGKDIYQEELLNLFEMPSYFRIVHTLAEQLPIEVGRLLEHYSVFLEFMANESNRSSLEAVDHSTRYELVPSNPFPAMKFNSDVLHNYLINIIHGMSPASRQRIFDWFLL